MNLINFLVNTTSAAHSKNILCPHPYVPCVGRVDKTVDENGYSFICRKNGVYYLPIPTSFMKAIFFLNLTYLASCSLPKRNKLVSK